MLKGLQKQINMLSNSAPVHSQLATKRLTTTARRFSKASEIDGGILDSKRPLLPPSKRDLLSISKYGDMRY
jgi:hypothetical protein